MLIIIEIPRMISKERIFIEFNTTMRSPLWGEAAVVKLVVLFFVVLFMCCSMLKRNIKLKISIVKLFLVNHPNFNLRGQALFIPMLMTNMYCNFIDGKCFYVRQLINEIKC